MQDLRERRGSFLLCACCHEVLEGSSEPKRYKEQMKALMPRLVSSLERGIPLVQWHLSSRIFRASDPHAIRLCMWLVHCDGA